MNKYILYFIGAVLLYLLVSKFLKNKSSEDNSGGGGGGVMPSQVVIEAAQRDASAPRQQTFKKTALRKVRKVNAPKQTR